MLYIAELMEYEALGVCASKLQELKRKLASSIRRKSQDSDGRVEPRRGGGGVQPWPVLVAHDQYRGGAKMKCSERTRTKGRPSGRFHFGGEAPVPLEQSARGSCA